MADDANLMRFSLAAAPAANRMSLLRDAFGRGIMNMDLMPLTDDPQFELDAWRLPGLSVTHCRNSPCVARSYDLSAENDDFLLVFATSQGRGLLSQRGFEHDLGSGDAALLSCAERTEALSATALNSVNVRIERSLIEQVMPQPERLLRASASARGTSFRLLQTYLAAAVHNGAVSDPKLVPALARHLAELVALTFTTGKVAEQVGVKAGRLAVIKHWIARNLGDHRLSIGAAARAHGLAVRTIQLLFTADGTCFSDHVREQRISSARRALVSESSAHLPISTIALDAGFGDISYFNRIYRAAFGETPSDTRAKSGPDGSGAPKDERISFASKTRKSAGL